MASSGWIWKCSVAARRLVWPAGRRKWPTGRRLRWPSSPRSPHPSRRRSRRNPRWSRCPPEAPLPAGRPSDDSVPDGSRTLLAVGRKVALPNGVTKLAYSREHDLLFAAAGSTLTVVNAKTGVEVASYPAVHQFTDLALAPDQSILYATDSPPMAGTKPAAVHRYELPTRKHARLSKFALDWKATLPKKPNPECLAPEPKGK